MSDEVRRFRDTVADERRALFDRLQALILDLYPDAEILMWYRMPTYRARSGWVALSYRRDGVTLLSSDKDAVVEFGKEHPAIRTGKGSVQFRVGEDLPEEAVRRFVRHAIERQRPPRTRRPRARRPRHAMPDDVERALARAGLTRAYEGRPPYQRNDYLGWIAGAKRNDTRRRRIEQMLCELERGDTYMKMAWHPTTSSDGLAGGGQRRRVRHRR